MNVDLGLFGIFISLGILLYSAILHEVAHGFVADRLGDPTARLSGRLTLNPKSHIDPFFSILLPLTLYFSSGGRFIFGGAKPVPVDSFNLRDGRKDIALVALSGPLTNLLLAIIASFIIKALVTVYAISVGQTVGFFWELIFGILFRIVEINLLLAIFNLLPIPPLDGSKVFALLLPEKEAHAFLSLGQFGIIVLLFLLFFPIGGFSLQDLIFQLFSFAQSLLIP